MTGDSRERNTGDQSGMPAGGGKDRHGAWPERFKHLLRLRRIRQTNAHLFCMYPPAGCLPGLSEEKSGTGSLLQVRRLTPILRMCQSVTAWKTLPPDSRNLALLLKKRLAAAGEKCPSCKNPERNFYKIILFGNEYCRFSRIICVKYIQIACFLCRLKDANMSGWDPDA